MAGRVRVLHADDEPGFAELAGEFLEREDDRIEVLTATDAEEGLAVLAEQAVDCVVSDYDMPGRNGIEFLEAVREDHPNLPFVLFTGKGSEEVASDAFSAGATDYLQKEGGSDQYTLLAKRVLNYVETAAAEAERKRQLNAIEAAREGIGILDEDGEFIYVNEAYTELYGYDREEFLGEHWSLVYPDDEVSFGDEVVLPAVDADGSWHGESLGERADGSTFVEEHTVAATDEGELVCTVRDVSDRKQRERALAALDERLASDRRELAGLERDAEELGRLLEQLADVLADVPADVAIPPFQGLRGDLPMPVAGPVVEAYGDHRSGELRWTGWLIDVSVGDEVRSIAHGRVAYADWLRGYGLLLIIDHGDEYMSLYAHNEALMRDVGDWVAPGEVIALAGRSGGVSEPALYFELRQGGRPVDPASWIDR